MPPCQDFDLHLEHALIFPSGPAVCLIRWSLRYLPLHDYPSSYNRPLHIPSNSVSPSRFTLPATIHGSSLQHAPRWTIPTPTCPRHIHPHTNLGAQLLLDFLPIATLPRACNLGQSLRAPTRRPQCTYTHYVLTELMTHY
ncbi:hypothetical protein LX32DRAFT_396488 [Colletotrichum zoysiae]|uniref:Uncharacterized protein n=1 Tax=Colletotrichum zoysiae TaxID=1216348 RepID=A0AAD9HU95_9PEZI|nr:hypothetical protein LX32DRAFT_396488 [Colletotrichum zoysiae]